LKEIENNYIKKLEDFKELFNNNKSESDKNYNKKIESLTSKLDETENYYKNELKNLEDKYNNDMEDVKSVIEN